VIILELYTLRERERERIFKFRKIKKNNLNIECYLSHHYYSTFDFVFYVEIENRDLPDTKRNVITFLR